MSFVIVHCIVSICCSIQSAAIEHLGPICKQHGIELSMGQMISKGIFDIVTLSTIVHKIDPDFTLEPSCCKKQQKKSQPRNWFGE